MKYLISDNGVGSALRVIAKNSLGELFAIYTKADTPFVPYLYMNKSTDNGVTWNNEVLVYNTLRSYMPQLAIDSDDNVHIVWHRLHATTPNLYNITYIKYNYGTSSFDNPVNITTETNQNYQQQFPCISIDSADKIHIAWHGRNAFGDYTPDRVFVIRYISYDGSWSAIETLTTYEDCRYASIIIDNSDVVHIFAQYCATYNGSPFTLKHIYDATNWTIEDVPDSNLSMFVNPCQSILIDGTDIYVNTEGTIFKKTTSWEALAMFDNSMFVDSNYRISSMGIDASGVIYCLIVYNDYVNNMVYLAKRTSGTWDTPTLISDTGIEASNALMVYNNDANNIVVEPFFVSWLGTFWLYTNYEPPPEPTLDDTKFIHKYSQERGEFIEQDLTGSNAALYLQNGPYAPAINSGVYLPLEFPTLDTNVFNDLFYKVPSSDSQFKVRRAGIYRISPYWEVGIDTPPAIACNSVGIYLWLNGTTQIYCFNVKPMKVSFPGDLNYYFPLMGLPGASVLIKLEMTDYFEIRFMHNSLYAFDNTVHQSGYFSIEFEGEAGV